MRKIKFALGSRSDIKAQALCGACDRCFQHVKSFVNVHEVSSGQQKQPIGLLATYNGALARAKGAHEIEPDSVCVGIENGITNALGEKQVFVDLAVIVIITNCREIVMTSPGIQIPEKYVIMAEKRGFDKVTVGDIIAEEIGCKPDDPHSILLGRASCRQKLLEDTIYLALKQLNPSDFYL